MMRSKVKTLVLVLAVMFLASVVAWAYPAGCHDANGGMICCDSNNDCEILK